MTGDGTNRRRRRRRRPLPAMPAAFSRLRASCYSSLVIRHYTVEVGCATCSSMITSREYCRTVASTVSRTLVEEAGAHDAQEALEYLIANESLLRPSIREALATQEGQEVGSVRLRPPVQRPSKLLCAFANYYEDGRTQSGAARYLPEVARVDHRAGRYGRVAADRGQHLPPRGGAGAGDRQARQEYLGSGRDAVTSSATSPSWISRRAAPAVARCSRGSHTIPSARSAPRS